MWKRFVFIGILLSLTSCVYYNTFYNAKQNFKLAEENQRRSKLTQNKTDNITPNRAAPPKEPSISLNDKNLYKTAIDRANKVILYHPDSKYVNDALWLIGKSRFNMGEYVAADKKFRELIAQFPKSKFIDDSYFYIGMSQFWLKKYPLAIEAFHNVLDLKKSPYKDDAAFMIAYIDYLSGNFNSSITSFEEMLKNYGGSDSAAAAQYFIAVSNDSLNKFNAALEAFGKVKSYGPSHELFFEAYYAYGTTALRADSINLGMSIFGKLAREERYFDKSSIIRLKLAEGQYRQGNTDEAISEYLKIAEQFPKTEQSTEAFYRLGLIYQERLSDLEKAKDYYNKATQEKRDSEFRNKALARSAQITKLETYRSKLGLDVSKESSDSVSASPDSAADSTATAETEQAASVDSISSVATRDSLESLNHMGPAFQTMLGINGRHSVAGYRQESALPEEITEQSEIPVVDSLNNPEQPEPEQSQTDSTVVSDDIEIMFLLAELYHHDLNLPDSALHEYQHLAQTYPQSEYAPRALLASAYIYTDKGDTANAQLMYQKLIDQYPSTNQAAYAITKVEGESIPSEYDVKGMYEQAENEYFINNDPQAAMKMFEHIETAFPNSEYAIKSAYARAWLMEQIHTEEGDSTAYMAYADIADNYPETAYAKDARIRMGLEKKITSQPNKQKREQQTSTGQQDSLSKAKADSISSTLPPAPPVLDSIAFLYPEELLNEGHREKGTIIFKVKLDLFGSIIEHEQLGTSGNSTIDSVAVNTLLKTRFDMSELNDLSLLNGYFRYDIRFEPPKDWEDRFEHADPLDPYNQSERR